MSERCMRCGSVGQDRRSVTMECFYAMDELKIPLMAEAYYTVDEESVTKREEEVSYTLTSYNNDGTYTTNKRTSTIAKFEATERTPVNEGRRFTMRVCKACRAAWMQAIKDWYNDTTPVYDADADERQDGPRIGSGIFVRRNGATVEITEEEWYRDNPNREPVRARYPSAEQ